MAFVARYGRAATVRGVAPGRVNLIGEHTDYNDGYVLPIAIPQYTEVLVAARPDTQVCLWSDNVPGPQHAQYQLGTETRRAAWTDYVAGVTAVLRAADHRMSGFDASISTTVPLGAGLSSSASLQVALLRALKKLFGLQLDDLAIARLAHLAETQFVGVPVGIMDQMAVSLADTHSALFIDTRSLSYQNLPLPEGHALIVIDSGVPHGHAGGDYRARRAECEEAARGLGVASLRDATLQALDVSGLPDTLRRRARHVITENDRVLQAQQALRRGDAITFGLLMNASHASLRDDFNVSVPDLDRLVGLAQSAVGVLGARMTGGGFGGSIVALATAPLAQVAARHIVDTYTSQNGPKGVVLLA